MCSYFYPFPIPSVISWNSPYKNHKGFSAMYFPIQMSPYGPYRAITITVIFPKELLQYNLPSVSLLEILSFSRELLSFVIFLELLSSVILLEFLSFVIFLELLSSVILLELLSFS